MPLKLSRTATSMLIVVVVVASGIGGWIFLRGQDDTPKSKEEVVRGIDADLTTLAGKGFAGSVLLAKDGQVLLTRAYGLADRSSGRLVTLETGFEIGSLVKPFTAAAILQLESEGSCIPPTPLAGFSKMCRRTRRRSL